MKKFFCAFAVFSFAFSCAFAADNMRIFPKSEGEVITGFKSETLPSEIKINILYPYDYNEFSRVPLVFLFDNVEYKIEDLKQMFYGKNSKNPQAIIAAFRFNNETLAQEQFDKFLEDVYPFFELNYKAEGDALKRIILAKNDFALLALNSLNNEADYFYNLGMILDNTTALPVLNKTLKKPVRIFVFSQRENIVNLQNSFLSAGLEPLQNFFFKISENNFFEQFDLRYFLDFLPKIKKIKPILPKEILQKAPICLQVKTNYGFLDFLPIQLKFAPPVLAYDNESAFLTVLLPEAQKIKINGLFAGKKWSGSIKIAK